MSTVACRQKGDGKKDVFDIYTLIFLALAMFIVLWLRSVLLCGSDKRLS